jgi:NAD(P)-dependent dehydrogenase (short-subunit alcohol dehydrogenase family)
LLRQSFSSKRVLITGRRPKELNEAVKAIGTNVTCVQGDVSKLDDIDRLYEAVKAKGRIDIVFANAGTGGFLSLGKVTEEFYDNIFNTTRRRMRWQRVRRQLCALLAGFPTSSQKRDMGNPRFVAIASGWRGRR